MCLRKYYRLIRQLGKGGVGEVWLVFDEQSKDYYAMKVLNETCDGKRQALSAEARIMKRLHHSGIPKVIAQTKLQQRAALVMEFIDGIPLSKFTGRMEEWQLLNWAMQILDILAHVHACEILYLDLKPDNLLLDQDNHLHLIDFGTAQFRNQQDCRIRYGTIGFAPKEQYYAHQLDERCDIYAFGKTLLALYFQIKDGKFLDTLTADDTTLSKGMKRVIQHCIQEEQSLRISSVSQLQDQLAQLYASQEAKVLHQERQRLIHATD